MNSKLKNQLNTYQIKLKTALKYYKLITRQYRSITDDNISEELNRQFELIRADFKELNCRQRALLKGNEMIMEKLGFNEFEMSQYKIAIEENFTQDQYKLLKLFIGGKKQDQQEQINNLTTFSENQDHEGEKQPQQEEINFNQ